MLTDNQDIIRKILPVAIIDRAYRSGTEMAWKRNDALIVVSLLQRAGYAVVGVDVWLATTPGPTIPAPYVYDWDIERPDGRADTAYDFIMTFEWSQQDKAHASKTPYFVPTFIYNQ